MATLMNQATQALRAQEPEENFRRGLIHQAVTGQLLCGTFLR